MVNQEVLGTPGAPRLPASEPRRASPPFVRVPHSPGCWCTAEVRLGREGKGLSHCQLSSSLTFAPCWAGFRKSLLISCPEQEARSWEAPRERPIQSSGSVFF